MNTLIQPLDFSKKTFRASSVGKLCGKPRGKTNKEKYEDCKQEIAKLEKDLEETKNKTTKTYLKNQDKLIILKAKLRGLEKTKDDIVLSETAIKYLVEVYAEVRYGVEKEITSKYLESGKLREHDSIKLLRNVDDELYRRCEFDRQYNEFIEGECDIRYPYIHPSEMEEHDGDVLDVKSVWDMFTYQKHTLELNEHGGDGDIENDIYKWQGIAYCKLYKAIKFILVYCLVDMPDSLIQDELTRILYKFGTSMKETDVYKEACEDFIRKCKFDHIPERTRVLKLEYDFNEEDYNFMIGQIEAARKWLNEYSIKEWERETGLKWEREYEEIEHEDIKDNEEVVDAEFEEADISLTVTVNGEEVQSKPEVGVILCPKCSSNRYSTYGEFGDFECPECGYDTADEEVGIAPAADLLVEKINTIVENKVVDILKEAVAQSEIIHAKPEPQPAPQPESKKETSFSDEDNLIIEEIRKCKNRDECVDYYSSKGATFWSENKHLLDELTAVKNSLAAPVAKPEPKKETKKESETKHETVTKKVEFKVPTNNPQPGDEELINQFREKYKSFTNLQEFKDLYVANREVIDRNIDFRSEYDKAGKKLAEELANKKRDELQRSISSK